MGLHKHNANGCFFMDHKEKPDLSSNHLLPDLWGVCRICYTLPHKTTLVLFFMFFGVLFKVSDFKVDMCAKSM